MKVFAVQEEVASSKVKQERPNWLIVNALLLSKSCKLERIDGGEIFDVTRDMAGGGEGEN